MNSDITVDTTWYYTGSPYIILTSTVSVFNDAVLTIEPGVEVRFQDNAQLQIPNGRLIAIGTTTRPITFTADSSLSRGSWEGIIFGTNAKTSTLQYATIEYARGAVQINNIGSSEPIYVYSSTIRYAGDNDNDLTSGGAIVGGPDDSRFAYNKIYSSEVGIRLTKAGTNQIIDNEIYDIDGYCVGIFPSPGLNSANNSIVGNSIYNCRNNGIRLEGISSTNKAGAHLIVNNVISNTNSEAVYALNQQNLVVANNTIYNTALTTTVGTTGTGSNLAALALIQSENFQVIGNQIYSNGGTGGNYQGAVYISDTDSSNPLFPSNALTFINNLIRDDLASGFVYDGTNSTTSQTINNNAICVANTFEVENRDGALNVSGNWFGTNFPTVGTEITGPLVTYIPYITVTASATPTIVPADGMSTAVITITMNDGAGHTMPPSGRTISLTTNLGTLADSQVTLDANGIATTTLQASVTGIAVITATEICGYPVTTTVEFQAADVAISKSTVLTQINLGQTITYTIQYTNNAAIAATNVVITDTLPAGLQWVSDDALGQGFSRSFSGQDVIWAHPSLGGNASGTISLVARLPQTATASCGLTLTNSVVITTATLESDPTNNSASDGGVGAICADVVLTKIGPSGNIMPNTAITYTLYYTNAGTAPATNVVITDVHPITGGVDILLSGITLNPGQNGSIEYPVFVDFSLCSTNATETITNTGFIGTSSLESDSSNNTSSVFNTLQCLPDLVITKTRTSIPTSPGKVITYSIEYENTGVYTALGTVITDLLPTNVSYVTDTFTLGAPATTTTTVAWSLGDLAPGAGGSFEVGLIYNNGCVGTTSYTNTAQIGSSWPDANAADNIDTANSGPISCDVDLVVLKNDGVGGPTERPVVLAGDLITYTIVYLNAGGQPATGVVLTETLPTYTAFVGPTGPNGWYQVGTTSFYTYNLGTLGPLSGNSLTFVVQVVPSLPATVTVVNNEIRIGGNEPDAVPGDNVSYEQTPVQAAPDLSVEKASLTPVAHPGGLVTFAITVTNQGSVTATNVMITDTLPAGTTYDSNTIIGSPVSTGSLVVWNVGQFDPGQTRNFNLTLLANASICSDTYLINTVEALGAEAEGDYTNNTASTTTANSPVVACRDLVITKAVDLPQTTLNRDVVFTLSYSNPGLITATNTVVTDALPIDLTFIQSVPPPFSSVGNLYQWNLGDLTPGIMGTIVITGRVGNNMALCDQTLTNTTSITASFATGADQYPANNQAAVAVTVRCIPDLILVKNDRIGGPTEPPFVQVGDVFTYSIIYSNIGIGPANNVVITETLPNHTSFVGPVGPSGWTQVGATNDYTYSVGTVAAGSGFQVEFAVQVVSVPSGGFITNTVCIGSSDAEVTLTNNCSFEQTLVTPNAPRLQVTKSAIPASGSTVQPNQTITYTVVVLNDGQATANNVLITDTLPLAEVSFITATLSNGGPVYGPNPLTTTVVTLPVNSAVTMTVVVAVNNVVSGTLITNTAEVTADTLPVQTSLPVTHVVIAATDLAITKTALAATATVGDQVIYAITVTNQSSFTATNVIITDTLPTGTSYVTDTLGVLPTSLNPVVWNIGQLDPGQTRAFTLTLQTNSFACLINPLINSVEVAGAESESNTLNNTSTIALPNLICDDVGIGKSANTPQTTPNQDVVFTLTYTNGGILTATNVAVSDTLPSGISFVDSAPPAFGPVGGAYSWTIGDMSAGITGTIILTGHVDAIVPCDSVLTNTTSITTTSVDQYLLNNTAQATVTVLCGVDMFITKNDRIGGPTEPPFVQPGEFITYTLSYNNLGTGPATNVVITETLPNNTTFVGPAGWTQVGATQDYTYSVGTVPAGTGSVVDFVVQVLSVPTGNFITNTVCIGSAEPDVIVGNNCAYEQTLAMDNQARLNVSKSAIPASGSNVVPGQTITYTVVVLNDGVITATNVLITDTLPLAEVSFITATLSNGGLVYGPNPLTATVATLPVSNSITMTVVVTVNNVAAGTIITNTAQAVADTLPVQTSLPVTHVISSSIVITPSNFILTKSADPPSGTPVSQGDTITYTITAFNSGAPVSGVVLTDVIPAGTAYVAGSATTNLGSVNFDGTQVIVSVPNFTTSFTLISTFQVTVMTNLTTTITNMATLDDQTVLTNSNVVTHPVQGTTLLNVYLPIILKNFTGRWAALSWVAQDQDRVREVDGSDPLAFTPDDQHDGAFLLTVDVGSEGPKTVDNVRLLSSQGAGIEWDTITNTVPILGIFDGSLRLNNDDGTVGQTINGQVIVTIYASDDVLGSRFPPDTYDYTVIVTFTDGTSVSAMARIPPLPPSACELVADITVGNTPRGVAIDEIRNRVYVANYGSSSVSVIDSASNTVLQTVTGITSANGLAYDAVNNIIWVTNYSSDRVTPIQANTDATAFTKLPYIPVGDGPWGVAYEPVHNYVYVVNNSGNSVTVIDAATQTMVNTVSGNFSLPFHVAANPITGKVYISNFGNHTVTVLDGMTVSSVVNLNVGDPSTQPYGVAVDEIRDVVYVATVDSHRVVAIGTLVGVPDQLLGWAEFHRGYFSPPPPHRPVPMRAIAVNPTIGSIPPNMDDGGHVWTTTYTGDGSEANQALLIPKGWISYFHSPVPCNVGINPTEGIAINRTLDRAYVTSGSTPGVLTVFTDNPTPPLVPFVRENDDDGISFEVFTVEE